MNQEKEEKSSLKIKDKRAQKPFVWSRSKVIFLVINTILCFASMVNMAVWMRDYTWYIQVIAYALSATGLIAEFVFAFLWKSEAFFKLVFCAEIFVTGIVFLLTVLYCQGVLSSFNDVEVVAELIRSTGKWGMLVYVLFQIAQVVILPLPAIIFYMAGSAVYGPLVATLLASLGVVLGSLIAFSIGKIFGLKVVTWIAGEENTLKYREMFGRRGKVIFIIMQVLPFFPDDILCMVAGLTSMRYTFFLAVILIVRPAVIAISCYIGQIPFDTTWGIIIWVSIIVACIVLSILAFFYQTRLEAWITKKLQGRKNEQKIPLEQTNGVAVESVTPPVGAYTDIEKSTEDAASGGMQPPQRPLRKRKLAVIVVPTEDDKSMISTKIKKD